MSANTQNCEPFRLIPYYILNSPRHAGLVRLFRLPVPGMPSGLSGGIFLTGLSQVKKSPVRMGKNDMWIKRKEQAE